MGDEDLVGFFLQENLQKVFKPNSYGINCDNEIAVMHKASKSEQEKVSKKI